MAENVYQGDILELNNKIRYVLVLSKDFFNRTGFSIVCPVIPNASEDALHIPVRTEQVQGIALCEQIKTIDFSSRYFKNRGRIDYVQIQNISDTVQSIFDYYPYG